MLEVEGNGKVTLAVLGTKLDNILEQLKEYNKDAEDREARIRVLERQVGRLEERQGIIAGLQATYATIAAVIAGFLGTR